jgi:hypothetical protein
MAFGSTTQGSGQRLLVQATLARHRREQVKQCALYSLPFHIHQTATSKKAVLAEVILNSFK